MIRIRKYNDLKNFDFKIFTKIYILLLGVLCANFTYAQLEEIIVTASKRQTTLQELPIAVDVINEQAIERASILDVHDLQVEVPSLRVSQLQSSQNVNFTIRGFGNGANNAGIESSVGVFIDGVYRSRSAARIGDLPKLTRIEVLKGPQSTLFGKNASAGVISIVTAKPSYVTNGYAEIGIGNYNQRVFKSYITGGDENKGLATSLGFSHNRRDGYGTSVFKNLSKVNDRNRYSFRGQALYEMNDRVKFRFIGDYSTLDEQCCLVTNIVSSATTGIINGVAVANKQLAPGQTSALASTDIPFSYQAFQNKDSINQLTDWGFSFHSTVNFDGYDLTSVSAYRVNDSFYDTDADYSTLNSLEAVTSDQNIKTMSLEFRATSTGDNKLDWMVGGFYLNEDVKQLGSLEYGPDLRAYIDVLAGGAAALAGIETGIPTIPAGTFFSDSTYTRETFTQKDSTYSIFATFDYHIRDDLMFTLGGSYTQSKKDVTGSTINTDVFSSLNLRETLFKDFASGFTTVAAACGLGNLTFSDGNVSRLAASTKCPAITSITAAHKAASQYVGLRSLQFQPPFVAFPNAGEPGTSNDNKFTWLARLSYQLNDRINIYGRVATGFKASSWNLSRDSRPLATDKDKLASLNLSSDQTYGSRLAKPESSLLYELGLKSSFKNASINLAVFVQEIEDFQTNAFLGTAFVLTNADKQSVKGAEIDIKYLLFEHLTLNFSGTFLKPKLDSYTNAPGPISGVAVDLSGEEPDNINKTAISAGFSYDHQFSNGMTGYIRGSYNYEKSTVHAKNLTLASLAISATANSAYTTIRSYPNYDTRNHGIFNASAGLTTERGTSIKVWGRNILNEKYFSTIFPGVAQFGIINGYPSPPPAYGITVRQEF